MTYANQQVPSEADQESLSAYLDNQLTAAERMLFERRLQQEPELRAELQDLRALKALIGGLPPVAPPRSFTLDPATVGRPRGLPLFSILRLGSALATLLLALTLTLDLFGGAPAAPQFTQEPQSTVGAAAGQQQQEAAPAQPQLKAGEEEATQQGGDAQASDPANDAARTDDTTASQATAAPAPMPFTGGGAAGNGEGARPPAAFVPPLTTPDTSSPDTARVEQPAPPDAPPTPLGALRWAQIGLASAALALALGAALAWRQGR